MSKSSTSSSSAESGSAKYFSTQCSAIVIRSTLWYDQPATASGTTFSLGFVLVNNISDVSTRGKLPHSLKATDYSIIFAICLTFRTTLRDSTQITQYSQTSERFSGLPKHPLHLRTVLTVDSRSSLRKKFTYLQWLSESDSFSTAFRCRSSAL